MQVKFGKILRIMIFRKYWRKTVRVYAQRMRSRVSAGLVLFRCTVRGLEVLLAHPGGPLYVAKDAGHWTIPKGEVESGGDLLATARREFTEETGLPSPADPAAYLTLGSIRQKGGKLVHAWAFRGDLPPEYTARSNAFTMEWPPHSGQLQTFPEVDRIEFFDLPAARRQIKPTQIALLDELARQVSH